MVVFGEVRLRAIVAAGLVLAATFYVFGLIRASQSDQIASVVDTFSRVFTARLEENLDARLLVTEMLRQEWAANGSRDLDAFASLADLVLTNLDDIQALNWVSEEGIITRVIPEERNARALGLDVTKMTQPAETLRRALELDVLRITPPITLAQGGRGVAGYLPVRVDGALLGYINPVFRSEPLVMRAMGEEAARQFNVTIRDGADIVFSQGEVPAAARFAATSAIEIAGRVWTITITPAGAEIDTSQNLIDDLVLMIGVLLALGFGLTLNDAAKNKETLEASEERFALAMKGASDGLFDWDLISNKTYYSPRWFQTIGYEPGELPENFETFVSLLHPDDVRSVVKTPKQIDEHNGIVSENEFRMKHKDGRWVTILSRACIIRKNGSITRMVGTHVDISELRRQQSELERVAMTDELTSLLNRRGLARKLPGLSADLAPGTRLVIMHVDLDLFKSINDRDGHDAGDMVLKTIAERLLASPADFDVAARVGGDEFLLAKRTTADDHEVCSMATRLIGEVSEPIHSAGKHYRVSASIGVAILAHDSVDALEQVMVDADIALNASKTQGRGRCVRFEPRMRNAVLHNIEISLEIDEALRRGEFVTYFQPQIDLRTNRIVGFEALARWQHPKRGLLGAADFIGYAEEAHLVEAIDNLVFGQACQAIAGVSAAGAPDATISVNVSTAHMNGPAVAERMKWTTDKEDVDPERIRIEILETTLLTERTTHVNRNIHQLTEAGFGVELDDFGTGHTAIASLRSFPVSRIKIDRSLVSSIAQDAVLQKITGAIIDLGHRLEIDVLAEGIETQSEIDFLKTTNCNHAQGYFIAMPLPMDQLMVWIRDWNVKNGIDASNQACPGSWAKAGAVSSIETRRRRAQAR